MQDEQVLLIGLPETGKTTFLAALVYLLGDDEYHGVLRLRALPKNREHVSMLKEQWLRMQQQERTKRGTDNSVTLEVELSSDQSSTVQVVIPDTSGELHESAVVDRHWPSSYDAMVRCARGAMVFVHPDMVKPAVTTLEAEEFARCLGAEQPPSPAPSSAAIPWEPHLMPTDVKMVELLQLHVRARQQDAVLPVAFVVSAWDLVDASGMTPDAWLRQHLPLTSQYIRAENVGLEVRVFGISAQGGPLNTEDERLTVANVDQLSERIVVVDGPERSSDLSKPLQWLLWPKRRGGAQ